MAIKNAREKIRESKNRPDSLAVQATKVIDAIDRSTGILGERLEDWKRYAVEPKDFEQVASFGLKVQELKKEREGIQKYIEKIMEKEMPNLLALCGVWVGAKVLESAGSLERLAGLPSSTIQILGAEKAFFAHLGKRVRPPKHGVIFIHPAVRTAPKGNRGKIARKFAAKISIAAKIDYFKGEFCGEGLKAAFDKEVKGLLK